jgi:putative ABC transport system permease protein
MTLRIAWQNVVHRKLRALASIGGVAFSILLVFMQWGIFSAAENSAEAVYQKLDFDVALIAPQYVFLGSAGTVPREIVARARDVVGVASAKPLYVGLHRYTNPVDQLRRSILVFGVDPVAVPFSDPEIQEQASRLLELEKALVDREARGEYGPNHVGLEAELGDGRIRIVGNYTMGAGFLAGADCIVSDQTFCHLFSGRRVERPTMVLVRATDPGSPDAVVERLRSTMTSDVVVRTRDELLAVERDFFVNVKPIGIMFRAGVVIGFLVGAVTLYQILSMQVSQHIRELATMKAIGFGNGTVYSVVIAEGFLYALVGFIPAYLGGLAIYEALRTQAKVPVWMTTDRAAIVFLLTLAMCAVSCALALRRVRTANPADLFG